MMTIGDVEVRNAGKRIDQRLIIRHAPDCVTNVIVSDKVIERRIARERFSNQPIDLFLRAISQKHRTGLRAQHEDMARAIIFFVATRALVLANCVLVVLIY